MRKLTQEMLSAPVKMSPPHSTRSLATLPPRRPFPHLLDCLGVPGPVAPKRPSRSPISGRGAGQRPSIQKAAGCARQEPRAGRASPKEPLDPVRRREKAVTQGFCREPGLSRPPNAGALGAPGRVQPAPPSRPSAAPTPQFWSPGARPSAAHYRPHLPFEMPGGGVMGRTPEAQTLGPTDIGSSAFSCHGACAEMGAPPRLAPSPTNSHFRRHACALAARRPNHPFSKLRIEVIVGGSWKSNSQ